MPDPPNAFDEYQATARETRRYQRATSAEALSYTALGLSGEAGEVADKVKKLLRDTRLLHGDPISEERRAAILAELGDCLWYVSMLADELNAKLSTVVQLNIAKLCDRAIRGKLHGDGDSR